MNKRKKEQFAVITGASTGIGRAIAKQLGDRGYYLLLLGKSIDGMKQTLNGYSGEIFIVDLKKKKEIFSVCRKIKGKYPQINVLANVAGVYHNQSRAFADIPYEKYSHVQLQEIMSVNLEAPMILCHELLTHMPRNGKVINISGTFESGAKGWLPYYLAKKGVEDFTIGLAQEVADKKIQVNCISPSDTKTEGYEKYFPEYAKDDICLQPSEVAKIAEFLTTADSKIISGQIITVKRY